MRVGIDGKYLAAPRTGVQRYSAEIVDRLLRFRADRYELLTPPFADVGATARGLRRRASRLSNNAWEHGYLSATAGRFDLLYCPGNSMPIGAANAVVALHDTIPLDHPEWFSRSYGRWVSMMFPLAARRSKWVVTVSETSRQSLIARFPFVAEKISVVPNGVSRHFTPRSAAEVDATLRKYGIGSRYILTVGTLDPRKNLVRAVEAWSRIAAELPDVELVVAGMTSELFRSGAAIHRELHSVERVRWLGFVPDSELPALYSGALLMLYPSLAEGFGIPPLEAMACGRPTVVANAGALPEVCGDAAWYVDPTSVSAIAEGIARVATDSVLADSLAVKGIARVAAYTWDRAAEMTNTVLEQVGAAKAPTTAGESPDFRRERPASGVPEVSVIICSHNGADRIADAIESVRRQRIDVEMIVVDDGSDSPLDCDVPELRAADVTLVRFPVNRGVYTARNAGLERAHGEFVAFLDDDDSWSDGSLAIRLAALRADPAASFVHGSVVDRFSDGRTLVRPAVEGSLSDLLVEDIVATSTVVARRVSIVAAGAFDSSLRRFGDWDLWLRLAREGTVLNVRQVCALVTVRGQSLQRGDLAEVERDRRTVFERHGELRVRHGVERAAEAWHYAHFAGREIKAGHGARARGLALRSLRHRTTFRGISVLFLALVPFGSRWGYAVAKRLRSASR